MNVEETIEKAFVALMQARTYVTANSIPVVRFRDRLTAKGDAFITVHANPFKRLSERHNLYRLTVELLADSKSQADPKAVGIDAIHAENSDQINTMTVANLNTAITAVDATSGITVNGFIQDQGADSDGEYQIIRSALVVSLTYVKPVPVNTVAPAVTGTPAAGETVSCTTGTWTNEPTAYAYQWKADGSSIVGATSATYLLTGTESGKTVICVVTATNVGGSASANSNSIVIA